MKTAFKILRALWRLPYVLLTWDRPINEKDFFKNGVPTTKENEILLNSQKK